MYKDKLRSLIEIDQFMSAEIDEADATKSTKRLSKWLARS